MYDDVTYASIIPPIPVPNKSLHPKTKYTLYLIPPKKKKKEKKPGGGPQQDAQLAKAFLS